MKIPRCCKNCNNKNKGICNCVLPYYCNEWVEDDEDTQINVSHNNIILIDEIQKDIRIKELEKQVEELKSQVKALNKGLKRKAGE